MLTGLGVALLEQRDLYAKAARLLPQDARNAADWMWALWKTYKKDDIEPDLDGLYDALSKLNIGAMVAKNAQEVKITRKAADRLRLLRKILKGIEELSEEKKFPHMRHHCRCRLIKPYTRAAPLPSSTLSN